MTPDEKDFTVRWWERVLSTEGALEKWLLKLETTERSGFQDNLDAAEKWCQPGGREDQIFGATAHDEQRHAHMLVQVLGGRGIQTGVVVPLSTYWEEVDRHITDMVSCAAIFHLGEKLAADRFRVLLDHDATPADVKWFLENALPDEEHHARIFGKLAGADAIALAQVAHDTAVRNLKKL